jgi:hypothetical protein
MNKEFVTYEQALALKELGFDEECFKWYHNPDLLTDDELFLIYNNDNELFAFAPLKQQVFRWFREKYFLDCEIYLQEEIGHKFYHYLVLQLVRGNIEWKSKNTIKFKTYEEAENACIDKLIEIAKQQDNE